jgi:hypothetical protein
MDERIENLIFSLSFGRVPAKWFQTVLPQQED